MFAPQPIDIRYGNPSDLMALAGATGQAQYGNEMYKQQYQGWLQRLSLDQSFLENELNRRQASSHFRQQMDAAAQDRQDRLAASEHASELTDAYHQSLLALKDKTAQGYQKIGQEKVDLGQERLDAQKNGSLTSGRGRGTQPIDLVPATGPIDQPQQDMSAGVVQNSDGTTTEMYKGTPITYRTGDISNRDWGRAEVDKQEAGKPKMVPRNVRNQMDMIEAERNNISVDDYNALRTAASGGMLKDDQMIDDLRQAKLKAPKPLPPTYEAKQDAKIAEILHQTQALANASDAQKIFWAKKDAGSGGMFMDDAEALAHFEAAKNNAEQILAFKRPITNSNGATPTGGNPVKVQTPDQARLLPSGTIFQTPDGRMMRVP